MFTWNSHVWIGSQIFLPSKWFLFPFSRAQIRHKNVLSKLNPLLPHLGKQLFFLQQKLCTYNSSRGACTGMEVEIGYRTGPKNKTTLDLSWFWRLGWLLEQIHQKKKQQFSTGKVQLSHVRHPISWLFFSFKRAVWADVNTAFVSGNQMIYLAAYFQQNATFCLSPGSLLNLNLHGNVFGISGLIVLGFFYI